MSSVITPFELGISLVFPTDSREICVENVLRSKDLGETDARRVWFSFRGPVDIELKGDGIIKHFVYGHPYTKEMMAAIMTLFKELDLHHGTKGFCGDFSLIQDSRTTVSGVNDYEAGESYPLLNSLIFHLSLQNAKWSFNNILMHTCFFLGHQLVSLEWDHSSKRSTGCAGGNVCIFSSTGKLF